ncbi:SFT2 domain containing [Seminavis robusta]|uniref:Vesicle transport protein n=1 Tax=Seminavis robusta TaxID=568900 RepID=A0A9N8EJY4_9STRA|nr:SFT2 domain containing [Seminavis robusta]|eukprot:Sro1081_g239110.1 SFT2 domain containing (241) ;mRNA; r:25102-25998
MSGFGNWYKEQQAESGGGNGGGSVGNSFFGVEIPDFNVNTDQILPLTEGMPNMPNMSMQNIRETMESQMPKKIMGMNYQQRFKVFTALLLLSALFFALAFSVGMPMITVRPQKFAISFTFGSLLFMGSFGILKGPWEHLKGMCAGDRMYFTTIYVGSMIATLHFTFNMGGPKGYVIVMAASGCQLLALVYYLVSFLPGGATGMRILLAAMCQMLKPVFILCAKFQAICMAKCCSFLVRRR